MKQDKFKRSTPKFKEHLYLICEGITDKLFLEHVIAFLNTEEELQYNIVVRESKTLNKVVETFRKIKSINNYNKVLIFIDLDGKEDSNIKYIISELKNGGYRYKNHIYFVNPVVECLFVLAKEFKNTINLKKDDYKTDIKKLYSIDSYEGTETQCRKILNLIGIEEYLFFKKNISKCNKEPFNIPSTNIIDLLNYLINT